MPILFILFIAVPLIEMAILIQVGKWIGVWDTILLVVGLSLFGAYIISRQSLKSVLDAQQSLARGELPINSVIDGACLMLAGGLLLTPGLLTDVLGLLLLIPPLRRAFAKWVFTRMLQSGRVDISVFGSQSRTNARPMRPDDDAARSPRPAPGDGPIIDAEFERLDEKTVRSGKPSGHGSPGRRPDSKP